jgi:hypothetical protein
MSKYSLQHSVRKCPQPLFLSERNRDQVSHQYKTTGKIIFLYILMLTFLESTWEDNGF